MATTPTPKSKKRSPYAADRGIPAAYEGETVTRRRFMEINALTVGGIASAAFGLPALGFAVGPMFASATKPQKHIAGPETLRQVSERTELPLVAIGGITATNVHQVIQAGAACICVCSAVIGADDVTQAAAQLAPTLNK